MKTIAVLTDFSKRAENAARYALRLAQNIHANILLYNSFLLPSAQPLGEQIAWPLESFDDMEVDSEKELSKFAEKLEAEIAELADVFKPAISYKSEEGNLFVNLRGLSSNKDISLLVMANHEKGFARLLLDNDMREVIEHTTLPVLIIPEHRTFTRLEKIAFATDLSASDLEVIHVLKDIAKPFNAEIMLVHICSDPYAHESKIEVRDFLADVTNNIDYPHIYYRCVTDNHVKSGLDWLTEHVPVDMLVMVHRNKNILAKIFNRSNTEKVAAEVNLPLLIYPGVKPQV